MERLFLGVDESHRASAVERDYTFVGVFSSVPEDAECELFFSKRKLPLDQLERSFYDERRRFVWVECPEGHPKGVINSVPALIKKYVGRMGIKKGLELDVRVDGNLSKAFRDPLFEHLNVLEGVKIKHFAVHNKAKVHKNDQEQECYKYPQLLRLADGLAYQATHNKPGFMEFVSLLKVVSRM